MAQKKEKQSLPAKAQNPESNNPDNGNRREEKRKELKTRADVLRQKFGRDVNFEEEQEAIVTARMLADLLQNAIIEMTRELIPVKANYRFDHQLNALNQSVGNVEIFMEYKGKKRQQSLEFIAWSNRADYIFELGIEKGKTLRRQYPIDEDRQLILLDLSYEITNKLVELIPS